MILIQGDEAHEDRMSKEDMGKLMGEFAAHRKAMIEAGVFRAGEALMPTRTATTIRVRGGKRITTDGPFAETKEQLGGFYILECKDLDEAMAWASQTPSATYASVEIRPIMEIPSSGA
jgi:hypothetical protein